MADKKALETIFNNKLTQIQDENLTQLKNIAFECVKQFQLIYNDKKDFRKSPVLEQITLNLVESINKINNAKQQDINQQRNQDEKYRKELDSVKEAQKKSNQQFEEQAQIHANKQLQSNEELRKKNELIQKLQNEIQALQYKKLQQNDKEETNNKYDIIIDVKSLINIQTEPVKIQYPNITKLSKKSLAEMDQCSVIGIQGLKNKGKTFLLNELNGENFPSGFHHSTSGISVKVDNTDPNNIKVYLDSEGINKPARYKWKEDKDFNDYIKLKMEHEDEQYYKNTSELQLQKIVQTRVTDKFQDIKSTEQIQQQFLYEHSETIIIVVGIISLEEQKIISNISEACDKDIIVVHNLKEYSQRKHVEDEISQNLHDFFPLDQQGIDLYRHQDDHFNCVFQDQRNEKVFHCILAKKASPAGDYYNQFTYDFIKQKIQLNQIKKPLNIAHDFFVFLNKILRDFVELKYSHEEGKNKKIPLQEELLQIAEDDEYDEISLKQDFTVVTIKDILLDVFGRIRNSNIKTVEIELPGDAALTKANLVKEEGYQVLIIYANKKIPQSEQEGVSELFNNRNLGQISQKIKVGKTTENLVLKSQFSCKKGVYTGQFEITNNTTQLNIDSHK